MKDTINLQLFASGTDAGSDTGEPSAAPDAGAQNDDAAVPSGSAAEAETFDSLIKGRYKRDFDQRVQSILRERFKTGDAEMERLRRENADLRAKTPEQDVRQSFERLTAQAEQARSVYPGLDLRQELKNPVFTKLVMNGIDAKTAYEVAHQGEILRGGMQFAAQRAAQQVASAVQANVSRPAENGLGAGAPATVQVSDPRSLTKQMRRELRERVRRGEKIYW